MRLINKSDIIDVRQISKSVSEGIINNFIDEAQLLDLKPLIGENLYQEIVLNTSNYHDLLNEITYNYNGSQLTSCGLKKVLIHFAYARYVMNGSTTDTPFGMVEKQFQDGRNIERTSKKEIYKYNQQIAFQYWQEVERYLNRNQELYPSWKNGYCEPRRNTSFRINKISR